MSIRLGALAEIMRLNEKGELILDTKGAVVLNCGEIPKLKTLENDTIKKQRVNIENKTMVVNPQVNHEIDIKDEEEKEKDIGEEKSKDDGADDLII